MHESIFEAMSHEQFNFSIKAMRIICYLPGFDTKMLYI